MKARTVKTQARPPQKEQEVRGQEAPRRAPSAYGRGSIDQLPSGRWRVRVRLPDGSRAQDICDTEEEAERVRATMVVERNEAARCEAAAALAAPAPEEPEVLTLAAWGEKWLKERRTTREVRWPGDDERRWKKHVKGTPLAAMSLAEIRRRHVNAWVTTLASTRTSAGGLLAMQTMRNTFNLVHRAFAVAMGREFITLNPAAGVELTKRHDEAANDAWKFLTAEEIRAVETCAEIPEAARLLYIVAIYTGLRAGELWALRWSDVKTAGDRVEVTVRRSHKNAPKNGKVQVIPLLPKACRALSRLEAIAREEKKFGDDKLVFPAPRGGQRHRNDDAGWSSRKVRGKARVGHREVAGITRRVRFHDLRHTCASHLLMGTWGTRFSLDEVREFLRHGSVTMTERYAHLAPGHLHDRVKNAMAAQQRPANAPESPAAPVSAPTPADDQGGAVATSPATVETPHVGQAPVVDPHPTAAPAPATAETPAPSPSEATSTPVPAPPKVVTRLGHGTCSQMGHARHDPTVLVAKNAFPEGVSERSHPWDLNPRPAVYETAALPLS